MSINPNDLVSLEDGIRAEKNQLANISNNAELLARDVDSVIQELQQYIERIEELEQQTGGEDHCLQPGDLIVSINGDRFVVDTDGVPNQVHAYQTGAEGRT